MATMVKQTNCYKLLQISVLKVFMYSLMLDFLYSESLRIRGKD